MAVFVPTVPKKKSSRHSHSLARDGHTGMGLETQRHFVDVRNKMAHYVDEQDAFNYEADLHVRPKSHSHSEKLRRLLDDVFADGKPAPKSQSKSSSKSSTPISPHKHLEHRIRVSRHHNQFVEIESSHLNLMQNNDVLLFFVLLSF
ncbi:hypothetical protein I4U23_008034 [Adineta vaga]|nr:hypothetical protein I4U23_008034 [Adineta vaga]